MCVFLFFVCWFFQFLWLRCSARHSTFIVRYKSLLHSCSHTSHSTPRPAPLFFGSFQQHGAAWWEELVHGTRPAPGSKCWDTRLKMQREGGNDGLDKPAPPSMRRLQGGSMNPGHKQGGPHSARELGEPRCCQVRAPPNDWQSWGLDSLGVATLGRLSEESLRSIWKYNF